MPRSAACRASVSIPAPKAGQSPAANRGVSLSGVPAMPWTAFEVSQTMTTVLPTADSRSSTGASAAASAAGEFTSRLSECQAAA